MNHKWWRRMGYFESGYCDEGSLIVFWKELLQWFIVALFWAAFSVLVKHQLLLWLQLILIKLPGGRSSTFRAYLLKSQLIPDDLARDSVLNFQLLAFTAMSEYFLFPSVCSMYSAKWHHTWFAVIHPITTPIHLGLCRLDLHFDCSVSDVLHAF